MITPKCLKQQNQFIMLKYESFHSVQNGIMPFKFDQLTFISSLGSSELNYTDDQGNRFAMTEIDSIDDLRFIDSLARSGAILNYKGSLKKQNKLYLFYTKGEFTDLSTFIQSLLSRNQRVDQRFCIQYFESFIYILGEAQRLGQYLKIVSPFSIGLRNSEGQNNIGFGLLLPFPCKFFNCILKMQYQQHVKYLAPQIIRHFLSNPQQQVCQRQFRKSALYSNGLILLECFGYSFIGNQRIEASKNDKQFRNIFKKIRKQIKLLHGGKFVPKVLKLLLQDCQKSREILETFSIKIHSPQFHSLKVCKNIVMTDYRFFSTLGSDQNDIQKSKKTINIEINSNTSPLTLTPNMDLSRSFKNKSQIVQNSPINIMISYEDQTPNSTRKSKMIKQVIDQQSLIEIKKEKTQEILQNIQQTNSKNDENMHNQKRQQSMKQISYNQLQQEHQVYQYKSDQLKIGHNNQENTRKIKQQPLEQQFQIQKQQYFDQKSSLRRKFQNESKFIMGIILLSFFLYGTLGYIFNG